jgi:hypothetical protein
MLTMIDNLSMNIDDAIKSATVYPGTIESPPGTPAERVATLLLHRGMVFWQLPDGPDGAPVFAFRPFSYELDTSLLATLHH